MRRGRQRPWNCDNLTRLPTLFGDWTCGPKHRRTNPIRRLRAELSPPAASCNLARTASSFVASREPDASQPVQVFSEKSSVPVVFIEQVFMILFTNLMSQCLHWSVLQVVHLRAIQVQAWRSTGACGRRTRQPRGAQRQTTQRPVPTRGLPGNRRAPLSPPVPIETSTTVRGAGLLVSYERVATEKGENERKAAAHAESQRHRAFSFQQMHRLTVPGSCFHPRIACSAKPSIPCDCIRPAVNRLQQLGSSTLDAMSLVLKYGAFRVQDREASYTLKHSTLPLWNLLSTCSHRQALNASMVATTVGDALAVAITSSCFWQCCSVSHMFLVVITLARIHSHHWCKCITITSARI